MASETSNNFYVSGPSHLKIIDWNSEDHRRVVAASLVKGVYTLEQDRQSKRYGPRALAPPWWEFFQFQLLRELVDDADDSIFGAIFYNSEIPSGSHQWNSTRSNYYGNHKYRSPRKEKPQYVIALRGTLPKLHSIPRDLELDLYIIMNELHKTSRVQIALQAVQAVWETDAAARGGLYLYSSHWNSKIWLAGHSQGAAISMLAGKDMAMRGIFLEAFLFNPPFIKESRLTRAVQAAGRVAAARRLRMADAAAMDGSNESSSQQNCLHPFLSAWVPNIFVHPSDHICKEYIGYFEQGEKMEELRLGDIARSATNYSRASEIVTASLQQAVHLLPSASLIVSKSPASNLKQAHALCQWWRHDLLLDNRVYRYGSSNWC